MRFRTAPYSVSAIVIAALTVLGTLWATTPVAYAEETQCTGPIGAQSLDNIFVPDGQNCVLTGTQAQGIVQVGTGASLQVSGVTVNGNIQAEGATAVTVDNNSTVGGSIQIKQGGAATVTGVKVTGDILFDENSGAIAASGNQVGGNLQAFKNSGGLAINDNTIDGNLQCKENNPAPAGSGNQAASLEDQCAGLGSEDGGGDDGGGDSDDVKRYGRITSFPPAPYTGTWVINGVSYTADGSTQFEQAYGAFAEGICVEVEFAAATPTLAKKIETEEDYKCSGRTGDDDDDAEGELYGVVTEFPVGLVGTWVVGGKSFEATAQTEFDDKGGTFAKGVTVKVEFTTDSAGVNRAKEIELKYGDDGDDDDDDDEYGDAPGAEGQAYGLLESRPAERNGEWVIGGIAYLVDDGTELDDAAELVVGARVKVEYTVRSDGTRRAHEIEATDDDGEVDDDANSKLVGFVQQMPAAGFMGIWKIAGLEFEAGPGTKFEQEYGAFAVGSYVEVEYRMEGGTRRIYKIETHVPPGAGTDDDLGKIESIGGQAAAAAPNATVWQIGGTAYSVTPATQLLDRGGPLAVGAQVMVNSFTASDSSRVATRIQAYLEVGRVYLPMLQE